MNATSNTQEPLVLSYLGLRKGIGIIGIGLPFVLIIGKWVLESPGISDSLSAYYYTVTRDIFVGSLWATAVFLICYRYEHLNFDDILGDVAGACAIGVALFPTAPDRGATQHQMMIGMWHYIFAGCFFVSLAIFALVLFPKTNQPVRTNPQKKKRDAAYRICGSIIVLCIVYMFLHGLFLSGIVWLQPLHPVCWVEAIAVWAFGFAWLVKGETLWRDTKSGDVVMSGSVVLQK